MARGVVSVFSPGAFSEGAFNPDGLLFDAVEPAFLDTSFSRSAFSEEAYSFETGPTPPPADVAVAGPPVGGGYNPSQGLYPRYPDKLARSKDRERFGIRDAVALAIAEVAARQAERLEQDEHKRFEELHRELELRGIEWRASYLEALNLERGRLIDAEIGRLLKRKLEDEMIVLMLLAAAVG